MKSFLSLVIIVLGVMIAAPSFDSVGEPVGYEQADLSGSVVVVFVAPVNDFSHYEFAPTFEALEIALPLAGKQPVILNLDKDQFELIHLEVIELYNSRLKLALSAKLINRGAFMPLIYPHIGGNRLA